jgi:hypothetical protein
MTHDPSPADPSPAAIYGRLEQVVIPEIRNALSPIDVMRVVLALGTNMALSGVGRDGTVAELRALIACVRRGGTIAVATWDDVQPQGTA